MGNGSKDKSEKNIESASIQNQQFSLDLGLGDLLHTKTLPDSISAKKIETNLGLTTESSPAAISPFEQLAISGQWIKLLEETERNLGNQKLRSENPSNWLESQAWWIMAQLELKNLPSGVLAAPVEAMLDHQLRANAARSQQPDQSESLHLDLESSNTLVKRTSCALARAYFAQGDFLAALQLIDRSRQLSGDCNCFLDLLKQFSTSLDALTGKEQQIYLKLRQELGGNLKTNAETIAQNKIETQRDILPSANFSPSSESALNSAALNLPEKRNSFYFGVFGIFLILFVLAASILLFYFEFPKPRQSFPSQFVKFDLPTADMQLPKPEAITKMSEIDTVLYGMGEKQSKAQTILAPTGPELSSTVEVTSALKNKSSVDSNAAESVSNAVVAAAPTAAIAVTRQKVNINVQGPIESEQLRAIREQGKASKRQTEPNSHVVVPGPAIAPRFELFSTPRIYETIRATNLMLKPSLNSDPVAGLDKGNRIKVIGMAGYWLKIMSRQGRIAYVLGEDAEPER